MLFAVDAADRRLCFGIARHLDEAEPFAASGKLVRDDSGGLYGAVLREDFLQLGIGGCVGQAPDIDPIRHVLPPCWVRG